MNMRRFLKIIVLAMVFGLLVTGTVWASASQEAALRAAFNTGFTAGDTIMWNVPNDQAVNVAAPLLGFEGRIHPLLDDQAFCSDQVLGTWIVIFDIQEYKDSLELWSNEFILDGVPLDNEITPIKRIFPTFHDGFKYWAFAEGVPVLGTLPVGEHTLDWVAYSDGALIFDEAITFDVEVCEG